MERLGKAPSPTRLARREAIIEAALTVLAEDGYAAAGVARIAARAGVATGSVAYYFGGKDTLFEDPWVTARSIRDSIDGVPRLLRRRRDLNLPAVGRELADLYVAATMAAADVRVTPPATAPGSPDARPGTA